MELISIAQVQPQVLDRVEVIVLIYFPSYVAVSSVRPTVSKWVFLSWLRL